MRHSFWQAAVLAWCLSTGTLDVLQLRAEENLEAGIARLKPAVWLDAAAEARRRKLAAAPNTEVPLEAWHDRSGHQRHFRQPDPATQPRLVSLRGQHLVRFNGHGQHLRCLGTGLRLQQTTLFLVVRPASNLGGFRAFFAANAPGQRDYQTGLTVDLGPSATLQLQWLNVEGYGFPGARNLLLQPRPLGMLHVLRVVLSPGRKQVALHVDGRPEGTRPWQPLPLSAEEMTVGARYYTNGPGPQQVRGFLAGEVAEVLLFDRELPPDELKQVEHYLLAKYDPLRRQLAQEAKRRVQNRLGRKETLPQVPQVQVLVPGFDVLALPVRLPNINNVRYRPDGTLVALGYNGNIYLLRDRDGDGLEEHVELFWDNRGRLVGPIGMALTPPGYKHGQGVFVASKGKVSLIVDTDGDDRADRELVVASGWEPLPHGVDALGVALDRQGNIYFGLGTANFANPYLLDPEGRAHYRLDSPRGTIQRVSADFRTRETLCTGVRFPVALAFNRYGHLFCTDQEGATWLPNGNPFDELLWIRPGRHYGFPPRHPKHLPGVVDEPSVFDYGPQHQSTCGLVFNEPVAPKGRIFGPAWWQGDALVCGESRGKLFRTQVVRNHYGYTARTQTLACLSRLTVDACVSPRGELVVCTHSGLPDWGTGPQGTGKLFKLVPAKEPPPRPVLVYASVPGKIHVVFDHPLPSTALEQVQGKVRIIYGRYVRAGERFEVLIPPYEVVQRQLLSPRYELPVEQVELSPDRHVLVLHTPPFHRPYYYAVTLPRLDSRSAVPRALKQHPAIDLDFQPTGVVLRLADAKGRPLWQGWLPHLDTALARGFTTGSPEHRRLWQQAEAETWGLHAQLRLDHMLRPRLQEGSKLDYVPPPEEVTVRLEADCPLELTLGKPPLRKRSGRQEPGQGQPARWWAEFTVRPRGGELWPLAVRLHAGGRVPRLTVGFSTDQDRHLRPLSPGRLWLPWVEALLPQEQLALRSATLEKLKGASWGRGRQLFFGQKAGCAKCHRIRGQGGRIGPDLSNLVHRDYESVRRDILKPSFAINPDYVSYSILLDDGRVLIGPVRTQGGKLIVGTDQGQEVHIDRDAVELMKPSPLSIMPEQIGKQLSAAELNDLLAFLLLPPPRMPLEPQPQPPPVRSRAEVLRALGPPRPPEKPLRRLKIVLVAGPKDHGPNEHDYPAWQRAWAELLRAAPQTQVVTRWQWPTPKDYNTAHLIVFYKQLNYRRDQGRGMDRLLARGGGLVFIHWAVHGGEAPEELARRIGLAAGSGLGFRHGPLRLQVLPAVRKHPVVRGLEGLQLVDESYWHLKGEPKRLTVLLTSREEGRPRPQAWLVEHRPGRVFVCIPGHYSWTFDDPLYRLLLLRGMAWAAGEPVQRFQQLVWPGARVSGTPGP